MVGFIMRFSRPPPPTPEPLLWPAILYLAHTLLEIALGAIKLRGRYAHEAPGSKSKRNEMYCRHHAASLLAHALLGWLVYANDSVDTSEGRGASMVLFVFHGGAVAAFLYTWAQGAIPLSKVVVPHLPFAIGFAVHALM